MKSNGSENVKRKGASHEINANRIYIHALFEAIICVNGIRIKEKL